MESGESGIRGIDHVVLAVRDLERARSLWERLGFTLTPRGRHIGQPTANYCVMFGSDYLELMGAEPGSTLRQSGRGSGNLPPTEEGEEGTNRGDFAERLSAFLERGEGAMRVAFAPSGTPEEAREALLRRGLHPSPVRALEREILLPEGNLQPQFRLIDLPFAETPGLEGFLCYHVTPNIVRRREWLSHPNGAFRIKGIDVLVAGTASLLPAYDRLFGLARVATTDAVAAIDSGRHRITFASPDDFLTIHPGIELDSDFPLPRIVAVEFEIVNREATAEVLDRAGIAFADLPHRTLAVSERNANGVFLFFSEG
jgi:catechol 2,3-dioxygenase-like lactoylglutathione lyase family enzyme